MKSNQKQCIKLLLLVFLICLHFLAIAQQDTLKVLFVGNSYTYVNNLPQVVSLLSETTQTKLITNKSTAGGAYLYQHWKGERNLKTKNIIKEGDFDIVVLQDNSMSAINSPDSLLKYVHLFADFIEENGAKPYLYNTWARKKVPQFQKTIDEVYTKAAIRNDANNVPVGSAWELSIKTRPSIELFVADGSHPSVLGTYLSAYLFVGAITKEIPDGSSKYFFVYDNTGEKVNLSTIDGLGHEFCQRIASEVLSK